MGFPRGSSVSLAPSFRSEEEGACFPLTGRGKFSPAFLKNSCTVARISGLEMSRDVSAPYAAKKIRRPVPSSAPRFEMVGIVIASGSGLAVQLKNPDCSGNHALFENRHLFHGKWRGTGENPTEHHDLFRRRDEQAGFDPEHVVTVAVPYIDVAVAVLKFFESSLHIRFIEFSRQFLVVRHAGELKRLPQREIPVPGGSFVTGAVVPQPGIRTGDDAAIESEQRGDDLEGRTGREAFLRPQTLPINPAPSAVVEHHDELLRHLHRNRNRMKFNGLRRTAATHRKCDENSQCDDDGYQLHMFPPLSSIGCQRAEGLPGYRFKSRAAPWKQNQPSATSQTMTRTAQW